MSLPPRTFRIALALLSLSTTPAFATIDPAQAESIFQQAAEICARDHEEMWGHSLCGPILLVDADDRSVIANQRDANGVLKPVGGVFSGVLPEAEPLSDTTLSWSGTRWSELLWPWPMREDPDMRHVTLAHELFHRIQQDDLHIDKSEGDNSQLDTLDGRYFMQMEWRALKSALEAATPSARRIAVADAILFRAERYRLFPAAAVNEASLESNEGIAEYTGVKLGLLTPGERTRYTIRDLSAQLDAPSFVRSFAYATGPAYGLLLDEESPSWLRSFFATQHTQRFDQRLRSAMKLPEPALAQLPLRESVYDPGFSLRSTEVAREQKKRLQLARYRDTLANGPVLVLPLLHPSYEFKPQTLVPLDDQGTVYPTMNLRDDWGSLLVRDGGVLMRKKPEVAAVSAAGLDTSTLQGLSFVLKLNPGWTVQRGARTGDLEVTKDIVSHR